MAEASAPEKLTHPSGKDITENEKVEKEVDQPKQAPEEEEEEETCAFCKFMKGGGCKEVFVVSHAMFVRSFALHCGLFESWMDCVDSEKAKGNDFVETCMTQIQDLRECMLANPDYYRPMLEEEEEFLAQKESSAEADHKDSKDDAVPT